MNQTIFSITPLLGLFMLVSCNSSKKVTTVDFHDGSYAGEVDGKGLKHGKGSYKWLDGSYYEGDFDNDLRHGSGHFRWANGETYKGDYLQDKRTGEGTYTWPDGSSYQGSFLNGKRHGIGIFYAANGANYNGQWFDDLRHGKGALIDSDGRMVKGIWQNGKLLTKPIALPKPANKPDISFDATVITTAQESGPVSEAVASKTKVTPTLIAESGRISVEGSKNTIKNSIDANLTPSTKDIPALPKSSEINSIQAEEMQNDENSIPPPAPTFASITKSSDWTGTVEEVEGRFVTKLIDGIDTIFDRRTNLPYNGKMEILDDNGMISGKLHLVNGRMNGEELYYENGLVTERNLWENGKFVRSLKAK
ncbi:hypothetical protein N9H45_01355 [Opitutales bacterium]|nr:hypothetical protein [Opitutales bacterium]